MAAIEKAYTSYIAHEAFPTCVLFLEMNPTLVDVNVHPAKLEVKFASEQPVFEAIYYTVKRAIEEPLRQIVANAGGEGSVVVNKVREGNGTFGYNARDDKYEDMMEAGIIDPTKVARVALENAASIASMFLTTECVLAEKKSEQPAMPAMPAGGMGGMM